MRQVGKTVLKVLLRADLLGGSGRPPHILAQKDKHDLVRCTLRKASTRERSLFLEGLQQVLGPIDDARYVMLRKSPLRLYLVRDSFRVPDAFAKNKDSAEFFRRVWSRHVGPVDLFYTRHGQGRTMLLKAKTHSLYSAAGRVTRRVKSWS